MLVSIVSIFVTSTVVLMHIDFFSPLESLWQRIFRPKSKTELRIIIVVLLWWIVATWIQTGVTGIAGDGKHQYNLYFSTWACFLSSLWTLERWVVANDFPSFESFLASWPNRAPGWIAIFLFSLADLLCILDLFLNWGSSNNPEIKASFAEIGEVQWEWLLFVAAFTIPFAAGFVLVEIFRETKPGIEKNTKSEFETVLEGVVLLFLVMTWIPSVIVATTPGGVASYVGNAYFFTWASTVFVMETSVWWIHDWRKRIHTLILEQEEEYTNIQEQVKEASRAQAEAYERQLAAKGDVPRYFSEDDHDDRSMYSDDAYPIPGVIGT